MTPNDQNTMELRIRTGTLKQILEAEPELKLKLDTFACEKIAEEIMRKAKNYYATNLNTLIDKAIREFNTNITSRYKFPEEAREIIKGITTTEIDRYLAVKEAQLRTRLDTYFTERETALSGLIQTRADAAFTRMLPELKKQAREEFIGLLEKYGK